MTSAENYTLHVLTDDDNGTFYCVFEEQTQQVYDFFYFEEDAVSCISFLNSGGAFDGFTPNFMLKQVFIDDVDTAFTGVFT